MGKPAARLTDFHVCPMVTGLVPHVGGPILGPGVPNVLIGNMPAAVMGDMCMCTGPVDSIIMGSTTVLIGGKPAARLGDSTAHGGSIVIGHFTVLIGDSGGGGAGGTSGYSKAGAAQKKDIENAKALQKAAKKGESTASKTNKNDFSAQFTLVSAPGTVSQKRKPQSGVQYKIRTPDGKIHEGTTGRDGRTSKLTGYTSSECQVRFLHEKRE